MQRRLLVSVHDVTPRHFARLKAIAALLERHGLGGRYSALVVPNFWHEWPLADHPEFVTWLSGQIQDGVEPLLHGYFHRDESDHRGAWARLRGTALTAGEGEFLGLDREAARARIVAGARVLADHLGAAPLGFVAPAWLYSDATREVLRELGYAVAEDHWRVWSPVQDAVLARGPVIAYASRTRLRAAASIAWSRAATLALDRQAIVRLAIHPHDLDVPALARELDRALAVLTRERAAIRYGDLVA